MEQSNMPYPDREFIDTPKKPSDFIMDEFRYAGSPGEVVRWTISRELHRTLGEQAIAQLLRRYASILGDETDDQLSLPSRGNMLYVGGLLAVHAELAPCERARSRRAVWMNDFSRAPTLLSESELRGYGDVLSAGLSEDRYLALASGSRMLLADIQDDGEKGLLTDDFVRGYSIGYALVQQASQSHRDG